MTTFKTTAFAASLALTLALAAGGQASAGFQAGNALTVNGLQAGNALTVNGLQSGNALTVNGLQAGNALNSNGLESNNTAAVLGLPATLSRTIRMSIGGTDGARVTGIELPR